MASKKINYADMEGIEYVAANDLKKGSIVLLRKRFPCKLVEIEKSAPGKHGSAKLRVVGLDIFTESKYDDIFLADSKVSVPEVKKVDYRLLFILDDNYMKLQNMKDNTIREDLKLEDPELIEKIENLYFNDTPLIVTVLCALNEEKVTDFKIDTKAIRDLEL